MFLIGSRVDILETNSINSSFLKWALKLQGSSVNIRSLQKRNSSPEKPSWRLSNDPMIQWAKVPRLGQARREKRHFTVSEWPDNVAASGGARGVDS